MFKTLLPAVAALALISGAALAQSFNIRSPSAVTPVSADTFAIDAGGEYGARGTWCSAANYAFKDLGVRGNTRLFVLEGHQRPSGRILFGIAPGATSPIGVSSIAAALKTPGANLSVDHAFGFCADVRLKNRR